MNVEIVTNGGKHLYKDGVDNYFISLIKICIEERKVLELGNCTLDGSGYFYVGGTAIDYFIVSED